MSTSGIPTVLIGFGNVAQGYSRDSKMARHYPYACHAQALRDHKAFDWCAVVDSDQSATCVAKNEWGIQKVATSLPGLGSLREKIEIAVLATPPEARMDFISELPALRAILIEKPLGTTLENSKGFLHECKRRGIMVQVNFWRRADHQLKMLAGGELHELVGAPQKANVVYGNGLLNNGIHMVDLTRMLFGEVKALQLLGDGEPFQEGPIIGDTNPSFALLFDKELYVTFLPLRFKHYRENGIIIWGENGRLDIMNEGLVLQYFARMNNRAMQDEREVVTDKPTNIKSTVGGALYQMYENLIGALSNSAQLCSPGDSALRTTEVIEAIKTAPKTGGLCRV